MALYSIRLDQASEEALAAAARQRNVNRAVILREAIAEYAGASARASSPFARMSSLIGVISDGPGDLSEQTGRGFVRELQRRRSALPAPKPRGRRNRTKPAGR